MMVRLDDFAADRVVPFCAAGGLDEVGLCAWIAQAEPGETLIYHRGFLAVDATAVLSKLPADRQRALAACPSIVEYSRELQGQAAEELALLPDGSAVVEMMADYFVMRDQVRACGSVWWG